MDLQTPIYVVASHSASNGIGGLNTAVYTYAGAKAHQTGRGFLGFRSVTATGPDGIKTISYYHQGYPYTGLPQQVDVQQPNGALLRRSVNTWTAHNLGGGRYFPYVASSTEFAWELNGAALPTVTTTGSYDLLGNPTQITAAASDGHTSSTANIYNNDTTNWLLGQLTQAQVTRTLPGGQSQTRTSTFAYDTAGRLLRDVIEPNTVFTLATDYGYDAYGHRNRATVSGADIATRATATDYLTSLADPYPQIRTTNALGHTEVQTLDARFGAPVSLTGPNGLTTAWAYDGFGRKVQENRADGTTTTWSLAWCPSATCPSSARYLATSQSSGSAPVSVYYDLLGREVRSHSQGFNGQAVYKDTQYDILGRLQYASQPYFAGGAAYWGVMSYDLLGRPVTETAPSGATTRTSYQGLTTVVTNALNQTATRVKNSQGQLIQSIDALGSLTRYSYDPFGNLTQTIDPKSNIATLTYDIRSRKRSMTDPDMGYWEYKYNVLGELIYQMDAKSQVVTIEYDLLGRMTKRVEKEGISTWAYDTAAMGKGKLAQVTGPNGYKQTPVYDALSRPVRVSTFIDSATAPYDMDTGYDAYGRVGSVAYPTVGNSRFTVYNTYNPQGHLSEVKNAATGQSYWKTDVMDAGGHLLADTFGNGLGTVRSYNPASGFLEAINTGATMQSLRYTYDSIGNLTRRADAINSVTETFAYDSLNRLTSVSGPAPKTYAYDSIGNITSKSDVGTYTYGAKPHAVTATAGAANASYTYDANGNMTGGNGRAIAYTSFNLPTSITKGSSTLTFAYDANHARIQQAGPDGVTVYLSPRWDSGTHYEKTTKSHGSVEHTHYIYAGNTPVALYTVKNTSVTPVVRYLHKDHLGSIDTITDETGQVVERLSYDAFGKRRNTNGTDGPITAQTTHHGYTGHEMHDEVGLTNMNGCFYDPSLARFTQADPYIQNPTNLQDLNRYSYVNNNPLKYADPSGYKKFWKNISWTEIRGAINVAAAVAITAFCPYACGGAGLSFLPSAQNDLSGRKYSGSTDPALMIQGGVNYGAGNPEWQLSANFYPDSFNMSNGGIPLFGYQSNNNNRFPDYDGPGVQHIFGAVVPVVGAILRTAVPRLASWVRGLFVRSEAAGEGAAAESLTVDVVKGGGALTEVADATVAGSRYANIAANLSAREFQSTLVSNGYRVVKQTVGPNGPVTILSNGEKTYTIYTATSTQSVSVQVTNSAGEILSKIRLGGP